MLSTNKLKKKIKSNFPVLVGDNVVSKNFCNLLIKEISNSKSFDDMIMGGRSRINKGSKNFNLYIKNSVNSAKDCFAPEMSLFERSVSVNLTINDSSLV